MRSWSWSRSLRGRLVLGAIAVGIVFSVLFGFFASWRVHHAEDQAVSAALSSRLELARDQVSHDGSIVQDAGSPKTDLVQVIGPDGAVRSSSPAFAGNAALVPLAQVRDADGLQTQVSLGSQDVDLAVLAVPVTLGARGSSPAGVGALVVAVDVQGFDATTADLISILLVGLVLVVAAIAALSWVLTGRALSSVARLTESAEQVNPHALADGLPVPEHDVELGRLVRALNRMLVRLDEGHSKELAFASDASHRLRTPVATLRAEAELALRQSDPAELRAALENIVADADQLGSVVDRMLARSGARDHALKPVRAELGRADLRWQRQAQLVDIDLTLRIGSEVTDGVRTSGLAEIVEAIVDNALRFTPAQGMVEVSAHLAPDLVVTVLNTGPGVAPEVMPQIFDAWVSSRDASVAGGLGLWLAREAARELGGEVELVSGAPGATLFRVRLPVDPGRE